MVKQQNMTLIGRLYRSTYFTEILRACESGQLTGDDFQNPCDVESADVVAAPVAADADDVQLNAPALRSASDLFRIRARIPVPVG